MKSFCSRSAAIYSSTCCRRRCYTSTHAGAINPRCNSCIISDRQLQNHGISTLRSSTGRACSYGEYLPGLVVATLHASASSLAGGDATGAASELGNLFTDEAIIIGGDFNAEPVDLSGKTRSKQIGTSSRGERWNIITSGMATHDNGKVYDYFIANNNLTNPGARNHTTNGGSDHTPVMTEIRLRYRGG